MSIMTHSADLPRFRNSLSGPFASALAISDGKVKNEDLHKRLSMQEMPVIAARDVLTINLGCINEIRDLQSPGAGLEGLAAQAEARACAVLEPHDFVRVSAMPPEAPEASSHMDITAPDRPHPLQWSASRQLLDELIKEENKEAAIKGSATAMSQVRQLRERLERLNLDMIKICMDGNCQFRALSLELFGTQERHLEVRESVIKHITDNREEFVAFLGVDIELYLQGMSRPGTWGDELTLRSAADSYGAIVRCIASSSTAWYITYEPKEKLVEHELFVAYVAPFHYNGLKRRSTLKELGQQVGSGFERLSRVLGVHAELRQTQANAGPPKVEYSPFCCIQPPTVVGSPATK